MARKPLLYLLLLMFSTGIVKAEKAVLKPPGQFTYRQKKELDMGSKLMQARRTGEPHAKQRYDEFKQRRVFGAGSANHNGHKSYLEDDVVPLKVDPSAVPGGDNRFPYEIHYGEGNTGIGGFIFDDDSAAVWYRPLTDAYFTGLRMYFHYETELLGTDVTLYLREILDDPVIDPDDPAAPDLVDITGNGEYDFTLYNQGIPRFMGDVLWEYTFTLTEDDLYPEWFEIELDESEWVDVEANDFAITLFIPGGDNADLMYYAGVNGSGIPYNHGFKWYDDGGGYCAPYPCWVPRLNFVIHAYVDYYGPYWDIWVENIQDLDDVYESCNPGPYETTVDVYVYGTAQTPGILTEVLFIYDDGSGYDTTDVTYQNDPTVGGTYTGTIPSLGAGSSVRYWWSARDSVGNDYNGQFQPKHFAIHEWSGAHTLFINDTRSENEYLAAMTDFMDNVGYLNDKWNTFSMGEPTDCEVGYYGNIIVGQGLNGTGSIRPESDFETNLMTHMDNGGNFVLISDDYIYGLGLGSTGDWETVDPSANPFLADYLHVSDFCSDCSADSLYAGIDGTVSEGLGEFEAHPQWPDEVIADDEAVPLFNIWSYAEGNWVPYGGIQYNGDYKMIYVPWDMDWVDDDEIVRQFTANLMTFFNEETGPVLIPESRPTWGIPAGTHDLEFTYAISDFDGSIASADLHLVVDGAYTVLALSDNGDDTWSVTASVTLTDTSEAEYAVAGYDDSGNMGMSADEAFYGVDWAGTGAQILYIQDHYPPYDGYGPADADSVLMANLDAIEASYDKWDAGADGLADNGTVLSNYAGVLYAGVYDWNLWPAASANHPLAAYIEDGGALLYTSEEVLGEYTDWVDGPFEPGHFVYDVLGVEWVGNDYSYAAVLAYDDGGAGLINGLSDSAIYLDSLMFPLTGVSMADLCDPVGYGTPDMLPPIFLGLYAPPNGYYAGSLNGSSIFLAFILAQLPDDQQQIFLSNWLPIVEGPSVEDEELLPQKFALHQNYPNPFNPATTLSFVIPQDSKVDLVVYNLLGQEVTRIFDHKLMRAGAYKIVWDGKDKLGNPVSTGLYVYRLNAAGKSAAQKMMLLK